MVTLCKGKAASMCLLTVRKSEAGAWEVRRGWLGAWDVVVSDLVESISRRRPGTIPEKTGPDPVKKAETLFGRSQELSVLYQEKRGLGGRQDNQRTLTTPGKTAPERPNLCGP